MVNLLKPDIPSTGGLASPSGSHITQKCHCHLHHWHSIPEHRASRRNNLTPHSFSPIVLWWWEKGRTRRQHKNFRHSKNKCKCCPKQSTTFWDLLAAFQLRGIYCHRKASSLSSHSAYIQGNWSWQVNEKQITGVRFNYFYALSLPKRKPISGYLLWSILNSRMFS